MYPYLTSEKQMGLRENDTQIQCSTFHPSFLWVPFFFFFSQNGIQEKTKTICISFQSKTLWFQKVFMEHKKIEHSTQFECTTEMQFDKDFHHSRLWLCKTFLSALSSKILLTPLIFFCGFFYLYLL